MIKQLIPGNSDYLSHLHNRIIAAKMDNVKLAKANLQLRDENAKLKKELLALGKRRNAELAEVNRELDAMLAAVKTEPGEAYCGSCRGTGSNAAGNRPDDYGPHSVCPACEGSGSSGKRP